MRRGAADGRRPDGRELVVTRAAAAGAASRTSSNTPAPGTGRGADSYTDREATVTSIDAWRRRPPVLGGLDLDDRETAANARRAYLRDLTTGRVPLTDAMRTAIVRHVAILAAGTTAGFAIEDQVGFVEWLGVVVDPHAGDAALEATLGEAHRALEHDPHRALLAGLAASNEPPLDRASSWEPASLSRARAMHGPRAWLELLGGPLGYAWTRWERHQLHRADHADLAATDAAGGPAAPHRAVGGRAAQPRPASRPS